jgi:hypothetical protein
VCLYTKSLDESGQRLTGVEVVDSRQALISGIAASLDQDKRLAVIPEGPYVLPFLKSNRPES